MSVPSDPEIVRGYTVRRETWTIAGKAFDLTWPADIDAILDLPITAERNEKDDYMPYWAQPWPGSVLLAEAVLRGEPGEGRSAIELGCGIGLVSLAAAAAGWSITASDYDEDAVAFTELNAQRNGLRLAACRCVDYRHPPESPQYDCVLGADLLYERPRAPLVAEWVASGLRRGGFALLADPNRSAADGFPDAARAAGLSVHVRPVETVSPGGMIVRGRIWRLTQAGG